MFLGSDSKVRADRKHISALVKALPAEWEAVNKKTMPLCPGLYAIFLGGEILYVGKATSLRKRFALHQIDINRVAYRIFKGDPQRVCVYIHRCPVFIAERWEPVVIEALRPLHNITFNPSKIHARCHS